ncbi:hypothetical protein [Pseudomonas plecoglossicida]|nr:hypothetical protein [Pseudomonas plecoglossicida]
MIQWSASSDHRGLDPQGQQVEAIRELIVAGPDSLLAHFQSQPSA